MLIWFTNQNHQKGCPNREFKIQILNANPELLFSSKQKAERLLFFSRNSHTHNLSFSFYLPRSIGGNLVAVGSTKEKPAIASFEFSDVLNGGSGEKERKKCITGGSHR